MNAAQEWIPVADRLPEEGENVKGLGLMTGTQTETLQRHGKSFRNADWEIIHISHWRYEEEEPDITQPEERMEPDLVQLPECEMCGAYAMQRGQCLRCGLPEAATKTPTDTQLLDYLESLGAHSRELWEVSTPSGSGCVYCDKAFSEGFGTIREAISAHMERRK